MCMTTAASWGRSGSGGRGEALKGEKGVTLVGGAKGVAFKGCVIEGA